MKLLFILDPLEQLKAYKDTSVAMMRAAQARNHQIHACLQSALASSFGTQPGAKVVAEATRITVRKDDEDWYRTHDTKVRALEEFDGVVVRKDPPFDMEYVASTWVLEAAQRQGARVFNNPRAIRDHNEKFALAEFAQFAAPTLVTRSMADAQAFITRHKDTVVKPLDGMGGEGVFRVRADDLNRNAIVETVGALGRRNMMVQRYLPAIKDGDKRVLLIDGKPVPYCLARMAKRGEARANLAAGGKGVAKPLSKRDRQIAESVGPILAKRGLLLVGLDVIGDCLTEVNVTSPTCFREIQDQTGFDVAGMFLDSLEKQIRKNRKENPR
ncbi:MAG TPA: glutathione synthase [Burkholderiales bacterium]|nr:glutathione synthase [Burkholderiales bacterium]